MNSLLMSNFYGSDVSKRICDYLDSNSVGMEIYGVPDEGRAYLVYAVMNIAGAKSAIVITHNEVRSKQLYGDMSAIFKDIPVYLFPAAETILYGISGKSNEITLQRLEVQNRLAMGENMIVVASIDALLPRLMPFEQFARYFHEISVGQIIDRDNIQKWLMEAGYQREELVEAKGQFAIRGDIVDFYPAIGEQAYRVEFFDNEIDSIRSFDADTQRSVDKVNKAIISPVREMMYDDDIADKALRSMCLESERINSEQIKNDIELLGQHIRFENIERYMPFFYDKTADLLDYMHERALFFVEEEGRVKQRAETFREEFEQSFKASFIKGQVLPSQAYLLNDFYTVQRHWDKRHAVMLETFHQGNGQQVSIRLDAKKVPSFQGNMDIIIEGLRRWKSSGYAVIIAASNDKRGLRIQDMLQQNGIEAWFTRRTDIDIQPGQVYVIDMPFSSGVEWPNLKFVILTDQELFGILKRRSNVKPKRAGQRIAAFSDLKMGDYVVHENYGIGQYMGIKKLTVEGKSRDYLFIRYADGDNLYVPTDRMSLVQRYIGGEGASPRLSKLGGSEWSKTKAKVRESVKEMAGELLKLYASRYTAKGHAFGPDTIWQTQLEESFPYQETLDQLQAIEEIKADMESDKPMDRLLCGDVGYGKTEVALRAAFKSVMDGKQVAILVPTTVLAQQHYNTCTSRLADFPIKVDVISRFRNANEQKDIIKRLNNGDIDIIIGTHALLSGNIKFHDLGLLIVDEEQRFGVSHKEAIKKFKHNVDALTLTATPIPRTLHMSLSGIRDISIIETPPEDRYPVQTYVVEYDENIIRDAILKELGRGGQVYFVYNRINSIDIIAEHLRELVPKARIAVAHGRMGDDKLERVMMDFMDGYYDILLCTTIIETGLDIPNVNTLIVYDADRFGLAQLYQLRGRVGRSNRLAYAYLTYRKDKVLTEEAEKRLHAITEFTEFGSGFKIALRDLEIRGAGNLLGAEQHGHMAAVGYDMYCRLLEEAISQLKGDMPEEQIDTTIDLRVDAYIPDDYMPSEGQRVEIYKRIMSIGDIDEEYDVEEEIEDRFGDIPQSVRNLLSIMHIKLLSRKIGIVSIEQKNDNIVFMLKNDKNIDLSGLIKAMDLYKDRIRFAATDQPSFYFKVGKEDSDGMLKDIQELLEKTIGLQAVAC